MKFAVNGESLEKQRTGCIVVGVYERGKLSPSAMMLDTALDHAVDEAVSRGDLEGELGTTLLRTGLNDRPVSEARAATRNYVRAKEVEHRGAPEY